MIFLLPYMYSWLWAKLKLCQYKSTMVTRRAQDQVKETLKQPYQTTVSIECLPRLLLMQQVTIFIDAASYHEVCKKKCNYLRRDSRLENGWHISHLCPYRHKCSTFLLPMQWCSSRFHCNKRSLLKILIDHKSWQIPGALPFPPCFRKGVFTCIFHGNLLCHCKYNNRHFITIHVLMAVDKT